MGFVLDCHILSDYFHFLMLSSDDIIPTQKFTDGVTDKFDKTLLPLKWVLGILLITKVSESRRIEVNSTARIGGVQS
jgi:hypothetical protein